VLDFVILSYLILDIKTPFSTEQDKVRFSDYGESSETSIGCGNDNTLSGFGVAALYVLNGDEGGASEIQIRHI